MMNFTGPTLYNYWFSIISHVLTGLVECSLVSVLVLRIPRFFFCLLTLTSLLAIGISECKVYCLP